MPLALAGCSNNSTPKKKGYTVYFDSHEGTEVDTLENVFIIEECPITTRDGYDFLGWYLDTSYSEDKKISFPYTVSEDLTLHANWEKVFHYDDIEVMSLSSGIGVATAYMKASYEKDYLEVVVRVIDGNVFNTYTNYDGSVNGMNDNVEIYVSPRKDEPFGLIDNETINFLAVPEADYQAKRFISSLDYKYNFTYSSPFLSGYEIISRICNLEDDGFDGYIVNFKLPYSLFLNTRETMIGNTSIFLAMRNTDKGTSTDYTNYAESSLYASELRNTWTHPTLNSENKIVPNKVDKILIGDSYTDSEFFKKFKISYRNLDLFGRGISGFKASEWLDKYFQNIVASSPNDIVIHIGVNDINDGKDREGAKTFNIIKALVEKIHLRLPDSKIHWITITDNHFQAIYEGGINPYEPAYHYVNEHMKELALGLDYLSIIDYANATEGQISLFLDDGLHPNMIGYDILTSLIDKEFNITRSTGSIFGNAGKYVTSTGYDLSQDKNGVITTNGDFNQYAWVKSDSARTSFTFEASMSVTKVTHGDAWPKMGIVVKSGDKMLFYYIDMFASLTGKKVGYAYHYNMPGHWGSDFDWGNAKNSPTDLDIYYIYNQYTSLKVVYINGNLELYVNNNKIFDVTNPFNGEGAYFGLLSFNTSFKTNSIVVE